MTANQRVASASYGDLAYFIQCKGMCDEFARWCDEMSPTERLLQSKPEAREVYRLLSEGKRRGFHPKDVATALNTDVKRSLESPLHSGTPNTVKELDGST